MADSLLGGIATGLTGGLLGGIGQASANASNEKIASDNRNFQEMMSNTAYQRATQDMEKAGINPMLAYMQGGATTPGGSTATMGNVGGAALEGAASALQAKNANSQSEAAEAAALQAKAGAAKTGAEAAATPALMAAQTAAALAQAKATPQQAAAAVKNAASSAQQAEKGNLPTVYNALKDMGGGAVNLFHRVFGVGNSGKTSSKYATPPEGP